MDSLENKISSGTESENDSSTYEDSSSDSTTSSEENLNTLDLENFLNNDVFIKVISLLEQHFTVGFIKKRLSCVNMFFHYFTGV